MTKISVLISARRNSKYLAKFLFGLLTRTSDPSLLGNIEILVMLNEHDTWNNEMVEMLTGSVQFYRENMQLGRAGLHEYFNELATHATGDWIIYFCEDHFITMQNWDLYVINHIKKLELDPAKIWCLIPKFDNCGAMNQIISRGYYESLGKKVGRHGWIDSYLNDVNVAIPERIIKFDDEMFHDFTHDVPSPMSEAHCQSISTIKGKNLPPYASDLVKAKINEDQGKLRKAIEGGK